MMMAKCGIRFALSPSPKSITSGVRLCCPFSTTHIELCPDVLIMDDDYREVHKERVLGSWKIIVDEVHRWSSSFLGTNHIIVDQQRLYC